MNLAKNKQKNNFSLQYSDDIFYPTSFANPVIAIDIFSRQTKAFGAIPLQQMSNISGRNHLKINNWRVG